MSVLQKGKWRKYGIAATTALMLLVSGCTAEEKKEDKPSTEESVKADFTFNQQDLEKHESVLHTTYAETLLSLIANEVWTGDDARYQERFKVLQDYAKQLEMPATDKQIEQAAVTNLFAEDLALQYFNLDMEKLEQEKAAGKGIQLVLQGIVTNTDGLKDVKTYVNGLKADLEAIKEPTSATISTLTEKYKDRVDFSIHYFGNANVIKGFESIRDVQPLKAEIYGDEQYSSIMYVVENVKADDVGQYISIYTEDFLQRHTNPLDILAYWSEVSGKNYTYTDNADQLEVGTKSQLDYLKQAQAESSETTEQPKGEQTNDTSK